MRHPVVVAVFLDVFLALAGCSSSDDVTVSTVPVPDEDGGALADAGAEGFACEGSGVSKAPWTLAIDGTSAKVRWEGCRSGALPGITVTPESGGAAQKIDAKVSPFEVTDTNRAPLDPSATPDYAGTWYMHEAALTGLTPSTCYTYELAADPASKGRFCTARNPGDTFKFMAISDTNPALGDSAKNVLAHNLPANPDFVIHGGDIEYYASTLETWAVWFPKMRPMLAQGGFFPAIGNHESEKPNEFEQYYVRLFGGAGFDGEDRWYRFTSGGVYFFSLDTEEPVEPASPQGVWLASKLADAAQKPGYRFSVVYFHRPWVTCGDTSQNSSARQGFEPIFAQHKVKLVVQAHMHGYERFEMGDVTYVTAAGGGGALGDVDAAKDARSARTARRPATSSAPPSSRCHRASSAASRPTTRAW